MTYVFVYGTLKKGHGNHSLLRTAEFIGTGITSWCGWSMFDGPFPYVVPSENECYVEGEVYKVDEPTLKMLDELEGVKYDHYIRYSTPINVIGELDDIACIMYVASEATTNHIKFSRSVVEPIDGVLSWR